MKTRLKFLFLAFVSVSIGLFVRYYADSLLLQMIVQSLALIIIFLTAPDSFLVSQDDTSVKNETPDENDDKKGNEKENSTGNQIALVIAVGVSSVIGFGVYIFSQKLFLAVFAAIIIFVLIYKQREIKKYFNKMTWPLDVK